MPVPIFGRVLRRYPGNDMTGSNSRVGSTFGHYELRKLLGKGGMGEVYEAHDLDKDRMVAIKILSETCPTTTPTASVSRRESRVAAKLQEPHVIPIHDWGDIDGTLYIDMRLVRGVDLRKLLSNGPLAPERAVAIVSQVTVSPRRGSRRRPYPPRRQAGEHHCDRRRLRLPA